MTRDPYEVLGLDPGASEKELQRSYRQAMKRWHPDAGPANEVAERTRLTQELTEAMREIRAHPEVLLSSSHAPDRPWYQTEDDDAAAAASTSSSAPSATVAYASETFSAARAHGISSESLLARALDWLIRVGMWLVVAYVAWWLLWLVVWLAARLVESVT